MKILYNLLFSMLILSSTPFHLHLAHAQDPEAWEEEDAVLVGRISHVEGELSRYDPESDAWVSTSREAPFGTDDLLRTDFEARAEIILPNNTWARINGDTRIQLSVLTPDMTELDFAHGNGRLYNKSAKTKINATTPFGRITAPPGAVFDLFVSEDGVDVIAIRKSVFFHHHASNQRHEIRANSSALFADMQAVSAVAGDVDPDWAAWNRNLDDLWAGRMTTRGESAAYLPPELHSEAHALDKHGHWERVYYEGHHYRFWRPVQISAHWSPFSWGAWIVWHGDHVWVPHEPFGYVTHHYGNWIFTAGHWYWAPPVTRIMIRAHLPLLRVGFAWYPGRVSWIHAGARVGWIPLAPYEPYYTHRHWGRRSIVVSGKVGYHNPHHHRHYRHRRHAVVIHRSHLYRSKNYRQARIRDISHNTIRSDFRSARLLDRKVLKDYRQLEKRDRFHPAHKRHNPKFTKENRQKEVPRLHARHRDGKYHLRSNRLGLTGKDDLKPTENRRNSQRTPRHHRKEIFKADEDKSNLGKIHRIGPSHRAGRYSDYEEKRPIASGDHQRSRTRKEISRQRPQRQMRKEVHRTDRLRTAYKSNGVATDDRPKRQSKPINPFAAVRQPSREKRMPSAERAPEKRYSNHQGRRRPDQRWQALSGRQSDDRGHSRRDRTGRSGHHRWQ